MIVNYKTSCLKVPINFYSDGFDNVKKNFTRYVNDAPKCVYCNQYMYYRDPYYFNQASITCLQCKYSVVFVIGDSRYINHIRYQDIVFAFNRTERVLDAQLPISKYQFQIEVDNGGNYFTSLLNIMNKIHLIHQASKTT